MKLRYFKSKTFKDVFFYECCKCGLDTAAYKMEGLSGTNCKNCGTRFTDEDIRKAKEIYDNNSSKINQVKEQLAESGLPEKRQEEILKEVLELSENNELTDFDMLIIYRDIQHIIRLRENNLRILEEAKKLKEEYKKKEGSS